MYDGVSKSSPNQGSSAVSKTDGVDAPTGGRVRSGKAPAPRVQKPGVTRIDRPLGKRNVTSGSPVSARAKASAKPDGPPVFDDISKFIASRFAQRATVGDHVWQVKLVGLMRAVLSQPGALSNEGVPINNRDALVDHLIAKAVAEAPKQDRKMVEAQLKNPETRQALKDAFTVAQGDLSARLKQMPNYGRVDPNDFSAANLPLELRGNQRFQTFMGHFKTALLKGGDEGAAAVKNLDRMLNAVLKTTHDTKEGKDYILSPSARFALTLAHGQNFLFSLIDEVSGSLNDHDKAKVESTKTALKNSGAVSQFHHEAVKGLGNYLRGDGVLVLGGKNFLPIQEIGQGNSGSVVVYRPEYQGTDEDWIAVKHPKGDKIEGPASEGSALITARGNGTAMETNLTELIDGARTDDSLLLVMRYMGNGSFEHALKTLDKVALSDDDRATLKLTPVADILTALQRMFYATGQVHSDLAARNLIIDARGVAKLADFGLTRQVQKVADGPKESGSIPASPDLLPIRWTAPEAHKGETTGPKADVWSLGIMLMEVVYGGLPFPHLNNMQATERIIHFDPSNPEHLPPLDATKWPNGMAEKLHAFMASLLQVDPDKRPPMDDVIKAFKRDFPNVGTPEAHQKLSVVLNEAKSKTASAPTPLPSGSLPVSPVVTAPATTDIPSVYATQQQDTPSTPTTHSDIPSVYANLRQNQASPTVPPASPDSPASTQTDLPEDYANLR